MPASLGTYSASTGAMAAATPKETPVASAKKSLSNLKQKLVGPLPIEYLPADPLNPPKLRTNASVPVLRDKTSIPRLQPDEPDNLFEPCLLPLSPRAAWDANNVPDGPRFMSMEEADGVDGTQIIPRSKHYTVKVKMPTVWGVSPSRTKKRRRQAPPRDPRPMRIIKAVKRQPEMVKSKCKDVFRGFVQKAIAKRMDGCVRALQTEALEEQKPVENVEYKPTYRLKERKRRSILHGLPKPKRPLSFASVISASSDDEDRRRYSDVSVYSRRMSAMEGPAAESAGEGNNEENLSHRLSLVPFREWLSFMHPHNNPFTDTSSTAERRPSLSSTRAISASKQEANSIHNEQDEAHPVDSFHSLFAIPSSSFSPTRPTSQTPSLCNLSRTPSSYLDSSDTTDESQASPPSPTSSEVTITPLRFSYAQNMSKDLHGSSKDPVEESMDSQTGLEDTSKVKTTMNYENDAVYTEHSDNSMALESQEATLSSYPEHYKTEASPKGDHQSGASQGKGLTPSSIPEGYEYEKVQLTPDLAFGNSKATTDKNKSQLPRSAGKSYQGLGRGIRSAIPIAVHRQGSGSGGETPPNSSSEGQAGGVRTVNKSSSGSHSHESQTRSGSPRPLSPEPISETGRVSPSSSRSVSDYGSDDVEFVMQKPKKVFTGEYRTRPSDRFRASSYGPTLKIASSADEVIMGPEAKSSSVTPSSSPVDVQHSERAHTDSPRDSGATPKGGRPQVPSGHLPKRDISNRELAVARKPLSRPSLNNLLAANSGSPSAEETPPVPKVPASTDGVVHKSSPLSTVKMADSSTQTRSPQRERAALGMTPETLCSMLAPLQDQLNPPPRTSSLQALHEWPLDEEDETDPQTPGDAQAGDQEESHSKPQQAEYSRLPESKSYRMLDGFKSIFKQKASGEKTRSKHEDTESQMELLPKDQSIVSVKSIDTKEDKTETPKPAAPKRAGWNKMGRIPKTSSAKNSPAGVSSLPISSPITASVNNKPLDISTPSFARPTQSTRTKFAAGSKAAPTSQDGQPRRLIQSMAASTGSPQRPLRAGVKRPASSGNKRPTISSPRPIVSENSQDKTTPRSGDLKKSESAQASLKDIHACIAKLCSKARDESTPEEREKYLRLALSLQQQVSDFNGSEKEAQEAHMHFNAKKFDKDAAHNTLFEYFAQVQEQLNEE